MMGGGAVASPGKGDATGSVAVCCLRFGVVPGSGGVQRLGRYTFVHLARAAQHHHEDGGQEHKTADDEHGDGVAAGPVLEPAGADACKVAHRVDESDARRCGGAGQELRGHRPEVRQGSEDGHGGEGDDGDGRCRGTGEQCQRDTQAAHQDGKGDVPGPDAALGGVLGPEVQGESRRQVRDGGDQTRLSLSGHGGLGASLLFHKLLSLPTSLSLAMECRLLELDGGLRVQEAAISARTI